MREILSHVGIRDLIDIALVSVIIYGMVHLVKGTKAAKMLMGLVVLLIASIISRQVPFYTLEWILNGLWAYMIIAVIVIFQPEIRSALARMGESTFLTPFRSAAELKVLEEIVRAAVTLSGNRIGALIVIERETRLDDFVELGTTLDARVSRDLLSAIFHPGSPIHDGAVVIRSSRMLAAACFLPIALEPDISKALGTRHRAALAVTEETDAVAIIVSEETGRIALSIEGKMEHDLHMGALRDRLTELFTARKA